MTTHPVYMTEHAPTRVISGMLEALKVGSCKSGNGFGVESQIEMVNTLSPATPDTTTFAQCIKCAYKG